MAMRMVAMDKGRLQRTALELCAPCTSKARSCEDSGSLGIWMARAPKVRAGFATIALSVCAGAGGADLDHAEDGSSKRALLYAAK